MLSKIIFKKWPRIARENQQVGCITGSRNRQKHQHSNLSIEQTIDSTSQNWGRSSLQLSSYAYDS